MARKKQLVIIKPGERGRLEAIAAETSKASTRAKIVLASAAGETDRAIAQRLGVTVSEVAKWRRGYLELRVAGIEADPVAQRAPRRESPAQLLAMWERAAVAVERDPKLAYLAELVREANAALDAFAQDVAEFGPDATLPAVAERLLAAYEATQRRPAPLVSKPLAPSPAPKPTVAEIPASLIRRVAPDPRLSEDEAPAQFSDLSETVVIE